jgi:hypothetical protein
MATLDGKEVTPCPRCGAPFGASEVTVTKPSGDVQRVLCEPCQEVTAETYPVKSSGRKPARTASEDDGPAAAVSTTSRGNQGRK